MNPPQTPPANDAAPPAEPAPELLARHADLRTRARLLGNVRWHKVPGRRAEDVVQETLTQAWAQRHSWPATIEGLDKLLLHDPALRPLKYSIKRLLMLARLRDRRSRPCG